MTVKNDTREFKPRRRGPGGHRPMGAMMGGEKAKDFKGSFQKLLAYIGRYKFAVLVVMLFAAASTVFNVLGPKVMGRATTELAEGLMRKIGGTGGIDFDKILQILLIQGTPNLSVIYFLYSHKLTSLLWPAIYF